MVTIIDDVLSGAKTSRNGSFAKNVAGVELLKGSTEYLEQVYDCLEQKLIPSARDVATASALVTRYPGVDYVLQYLLQEGLAESSKRTLEVMESFPPSLLAETLNVAARLLGTATVGKIIRSCPGFLELAARKLQTQDLIVRSVAERFAQILEKQN